MEKGRLRVNYRDPVLIGRRQHYPTKLSTPRLYRSFGQCQARRSGFRLQNGSIRPLSGHSHWNSAPANPLNPVSRSACKILTSGRLTYPARSQNPTADQHAWGGGQVRSTNRAAQKQSGHEGVSNPYLAHEHKEGTCGLVLAVRDAKLFTAHFVILVRA
jgi:hypothetical protein